MTITAHTGCMGTEDNTLESIQKGAEYADVVEFDLNFTKEGVPVLSHDEPKGDEITFICAAKIVKSIESLKVNVDLKSVAKLNDVDYESCEISFDETGMPSWNLELGDIKNPSVTLDEIFYYLNHADKPCIVAIDEFQTIAKYPEKNVEAALRTHIQYCTNAHFIYSGSQRHMMGEIFTSPSRPFYQSTTVFELKPIDLDSYKIFIKLFF